MTRTKNNFVFGAIVLVLCNLFAKLLGAIYRVPLLKILGSEGLGLYQMIFPIYSLLLVFSSSGTIVALSKFVAKETLQRNNKNIKHYLIASLITTTCLSILFTLVLLCLLPFLAKYQGNENLQICYYAILPSLIISSLIAVFRGYFLGKNEMLYSGGTQILEQVFKLIFSLFFATNFAKYGIIYSVCGAVLGVTISEVLAFCFCIILFFCTKKKLKKNYKNIIYKSDIKISKTKIDFYYYSKKTSISIFEALKQIFKFGLNVTLEACLIPLIGAIDSVIVVPLLIKCGMSSQIAYKLFGLEDGIVASLIALPIVVASSIGSSIIPNIRGSGSDEITNKNINNSIKFVWIISLACSFAFIFFAKEITSLLYSSGLKNVSINELKISQDLLKLNAFNIVYLSLLTLSTSILQGLERSFVPVANLGISAVLRLVVLLLTLPQKNINIYGTALADMAFYATSLLLNIRAIKQIANITFSFPKMFLYPIVSGSVMCIIMKLLENILSVAVPARILTILIVMFGGFTYLLLLFLTKTISFSEIKSIIKRKAT